MNLLFLLSTLVLAQPPSVDTTSPQETPVESTQNTDPNGGAASDTNSDTGTSPDAAEQTPADSETTTADSVAEDSGPTFADILSDIAGSGALGFMIDGGWFMWPILLLGVVGAGVIIERYRSLKMLVSDGGDIRKEVHSLLIADKVEDALLLCDREEGPVPAILSAGLRKYFVLRKLNYDVDRIREQVVKAMDDFNIHIIAALEKHLPILATIASVAPMLGFLGTVAGMIESFDNIDTNFGSENIVKLAAKGIKVSLLTTAFGLIIGIPAFMAFNYFTSVIDRFVLDVEESATDLIEAVTLQTALEQATSVSDQTTG